MKSLKDIKTTLEAHKSKLFSKYPIESMAIFGSFARNEETDHSDLDVIVEFNDDIGIRFIDLANELEKLMDMKMDLVSKNGIQKRYLQSIEDDLIYV
ncbi:nucleotidyltransferase family protein [Subsaximicrobium wynnwilliamsii]|uniref:Nucleotidyltransferase family protein n=1 Tax=Subsaximicrobium wynnwilliamsii TaxID=291179 RepID=A0A5C6ZHD5_9FLAO|nr:nucleotidyltransferase family protein [Subsaximicrobium wynnwilliamsii]TXD82408.1 nucleotidyltransferase family protein [Subsaximicrobium wynnwilliamsii]TXD88050.1 nucleotidyltransferase family protein [Subsaximicrobium wynnwilliamsii]TXE02088.1 nucleotidyltransferase family protein [Subsaximicrobium wynnwilliamsii]